MNCSKTYLLYEMEKNGDKTIRLSREDGRLDTLIETFKATCLKSAETMLREKYPSILLEVYALVPLILVKLV